MRIRGTAAVKDRTPNAHDASSYGSMTAANSVDGPVGKAITFDGTDDYLNAGNVEIAGNYTIGVWARIDTLNAYHRFLYKDSSFTLWYDQDSVSVRMEHLPEGSWWKGLLQDGGTRVPMTAGVWYFHTASFDGSVIRLYVNGNERSVSRPLPGGPLVTSRPLLLGGSRPQFTKGALDEVRVERVARSSDWIKLCYVNQLGNSALVTFK